MVLMYMFNKGLCTVIQPIPIGIHCPRTVMIKPIDSGCRYGLEGSWDGFPKVVECVSTVLSRVVLSCTPETLNEIEFTVKLGIGDDAVPCCFDFLL